MKNKLLLILTLVSACAAPSTDYLLLDTVNKQVNKVPYSMTPAKSVDDFYVNGGNCRDFAAAKYEKLLQAGISDDRMQFTYSWLKEAKQFHTTLEVQVDDTVYVLDNYKLWIGKADGYYSMPVHRVSYAEARNSIWWGK
jgi:predicted transglutaminase-like cysteine proteinase